MKQKQKILSFLFIIILISITSLSGDDTFIYGKKTLLLSEEISLFFPREENSENEKLLFQYLENHFSELKNDYNVLDYSLLEKGHSFSKGFSVKIPGDIEDLLIIAVPLNTSQKQELKRDGSINIAIALQLLDIFSRYKPAISLEFLFLGGERGSEANYPIGSNYYLSTYAATVPTIALYLDISKEGEQISIRNSSNSDLSPMWMIENFAELFMANNINFTTESIPALIYQSGFETAPPVISRFLDQEIPILMLESSDKAKQTYKTDLWVNSFIESAMTFILENHKGFDKEWDRHYFISRIGNILVTLGEKESIIIMICIIALLSFILLLRSRNLHLNLKRFRNHLWTFPLLLFLTFMYLFLSTLIIEEISAIKDFPDLWQLFPGMFLVFKLFTALFLYSCFIFLIRGLALSPSHHFYTYSAFFSVILSMFTVLLININFSYFFFWSLIIVSIFMISRNEIIKRISIIMSPLPLVIIFYMILSHPYLDICSFLLMSRIKGNIFLTIIIMPSLMLISSLNYYHHRFHRHKRSLRNFFSILIWGSLMIFSLYKIISGTPFDNNNRQTVHIDEVINLNEKSRSILISSKAPLGEVELQLDDQKMILNDVGRHAEITAPMIEGLLDIKEEKSIFLDRMSLTYIISAKGTPESFKFNLSSEKSLIIFDSNFPYDVTSDGKNIIFYIGKNPILPLEIQLILPGGSKPDIKLAVQYKEFPYTFNLSGNYLEQDKTLTLHKEILWKE